MYYTKIKRIVRLFVLLTIIGLAFLPISATTTLSNPAGPELPAGCGSLQIDEGHKLAFHVYACRLQERDTQRSRPHHAGASHARHPVANASIIPSVSPK